MPHHVTIQDASPLPTLSHISPSAAITLQPLLQWYNEQPEAEKRVPSFPQQALNCAIHQTAIVIYMGDKGRSRKSHAEAPDRCSLACEIILPVSNFSLNVVQ